jgi:hypothetical protein
LTIECYRIHCPYHADHGYDPESGGASEGPFCYEEECHWKEGAQVIVKLGQTSLPGVLRGLSKLSPDKWLVSLGNHGSYVVGTETITLVEPEE